MPIFNDLNLDNWKESEILTDSLWIIPERDKTGKHNGFYHGNFIPQIPRQLILRYTKKNEIVFDPFLGSGTTAYEAESLNRNFIGIDIQKKLVDYVGKNIEPKNNFSKIVKYIIVPSLFLYTLFRPGFTQYSVNFGTVPITISLARILPKLIYESGFIFLLKSSILKPSVI